MGNENFEVSKSTATKNADSIVKKLLIIIITAIILLIPLAFIAGIISDRENYRTEAVQKVMSSWAGEQTIIAPTLYYIEKAKDNHEVQTFFILNNYKVTTKVHTELRQKGIFKVPVYVADVTLKGDFINHIGDLSKKNITLQFDVKDARGFVEEPSMQIANQPTQKLNSTTKEIKLNTHEKFIPFEINYKIKGLNKIDVRLSGIKNSIFMDSNWKFPSFEGNYLPSERKINNQGFSANWTIPSIAIQDKDDTPESVSVSLIVPVDSYKMADRSLKYSFLLLTLSFLCYFIFEITSKEEKRIHPIQYSLLGAAILIFYLLLVSISEFLSFAIAYFIATVMILLMIFMYTNFVVTKNKNKSFSIVITLLMGSLYLFFYILLQLQDIALLMGSLVLFGIISAVMYLTRNVDWYNNAKK